MDGNHKRFGSTTDSATTAWVNAVVSAGGSVSGTQQGRVNTLISGLRTDGLLAVLDALWIFAGESSAEQATIDITNLRVATVEATLTLSAAGYTGDGTSGDLTTTFTPSSAGGHYTQNSAHLGAYVMVLPSAGNRCLLGGIDGTNFSQLQNSGGSILGFVNDNGGAVLQGAQSTGWWCATRTGSTTSTLYKGTTAGGSTSPDTDGGSSVANLTVPLFLLSRGNQQTDAKVGAVCFGGGLNSTQAGNLFTRINNYMTAWGINV